MSTRELIEERLENRRRKSKALTWMLWLFMVSSGFLFLTSTLSLLARRTEPAPFPTAFWASTMLILGSELAILLAARSFKRDDLASGGLWLTLTIGLTGLFVTTQVMGWAQLFEGLWAHAFAEPSTTTLFLFLSILHGLHILGGIIFLIILLYDFRRGELHAKRFVRLRNAGHYWHFLTAIWLLVVIAALL